MNEIEIRESIFEKVRELYKLRKCSERFVAGQSKIPYAGRVYNEEEMINLVNASLDFYLTAGRFAKQFEEEFAKFLGIQYCILTNSGSSANLLAISALTSLKLKERRLKPGDEVITTACAFPTTVNPIIQNNLIPVFLDVEVETYNIQASKLEEALSPKSRAIFLAHTLGNPFDVDEVLEICQRHNLWLIEDNCDALGAKYNGQYTGTFGHIATQSFYPGHHMTMGEGGAVLTNDPLLKRIIISFRDWGRDCWCEPGHDNSCGKRFGWQLGELPCGYDHKYIYSHIGYNLKITDMQAAVGIAQLKKLSSFIELRKKNFRILFEQLERYERYLVLPKALIKSEPSWFCFPILVKKEAPFTRDEMVRYLDENKIDIRMLFAGNILKQPGYKDIKKRVIGYLKNTDAIVNSTFFLGVYPGLTEEKMNYVIHSINGFFKKY